MLKFDGEALIFCLAWAALAVVGFFWAGAFAGALLSVGLLLLIMPGSSIVLAKSGDLGLERKVRWAMLAIAALTFSAWLSLQSSSSS